MSYCYMSDCIHLHACRLLAKRYRDATPTRKHVARHCDEECPCYQIAEKIYAVETSVAVDVARDGAESIRCGYDEYDVYCSWDFPAHDAYIITNGARCNDDIANL